MTEPASPTLLGPKMTGIVRVLFWAAVAFALFMALDPRPPRTGLEGFGDKFQHMLAFGVLTVLAQRSFRSTPRWRIAERLSFLGALIEVVQSLPILHRDCDIRDWIADTVIIVIVTGLFVLHDRSRGDRSREHHLNDDRLHDQA